MVKFQIIQGVEMHKFFEQPPESALPLTWRARVLKKYVKFKYPTSLSREHLKSILIIGTTELEPNAEQILPSKQL
jgi:hypothetical protein